MAATPQVTQGGPKTFTPAAGVTILGGTVVEATASGGRIQPAGAASAKVLGVALTDAIAPENAGGSSTDTFGNPVIAAVAVPTTTAVAYGGAEAKVTASAAVAFGDLVIATANGRVGPAGATPAAATIVGRVTEPGGIGVNASGLIRLA